MSRTATRATAALLCAVVLLALGLAYVGLPETERAPESLSVDIDFDTFEPGITQISRSPVEVPVPSRVTEAHVDVGGSNMTIDVGLTICGPDACRPLEPGTELDPGPYVLQVEATVTAPVTEPAAPGESGGSGSFVGEIRIVEMRQETMIDTSLLMAATGLGLLALAAGTLVVRQRQRVPS